MTSQSTSLRDRIQEVFARYGKPGDSGGITFEWHDLADVIVGVWPEFQPKDYEAVLSEREVIKDGCVSLAGFIDFMYPDGDGTTETEAERRAEESKIQKIKTTARRQGVAAEAVRGDKLKDYQAPVYEKSAEAVELIQRIIRGNDKMMVLCGHLDQKAFDALAGAFFPVKARQGEDIIRQGDDGDRMYIIADGEVDVFVARPTDDSRIELGDRGSKVATLGKGVLFGELALMYSAKRAATIQVASAEAELWAIGDQDFKMVCAHEAMETLTMYEGWLSEIDLFKSLNYFELSQLSELLETQLYDEGETIIVQGEPGCTFYILEDGTCSAYLAGAEGEVEVKQYSKKGEYFGEIALLQECPRKASVRATGQGCVVASLNATDFKNLLGSLKDKLSDQLDKYPQYAAFLR